MGTSLSGRGRGRDARTIVLPASGGNGVFSRALDRIAGPSGCHGPPARAPIRRMAGPRAPRPRPAPSTRAPPSSSRASCSAACSPAGFRTGPSSAGASSRPRPTWAKRTRPATRAPRTPHRSALRSARACVRLSLTYLQHALHAERRRRARGAPGRRPDPRSRADRGIEHMTRARGAASRAALKHLAEVRHIAAGPARLTQAFAIDLGTTAPTCADPRSGSSRASRCRIAASGRRRASAARRRPRRGT